MKLPPLSRFLKELIFNGFESFGKYYSEYRGFVVDNSDLEGLHRVKLLVPEITGDVPYEYWAYPVGVMGGISTEGNPYGFQMLPQKGELVWVTFERGNPNVPLWRLGYKGESDVNFDIALFDPNSYWFITPQGNRVVINDTNNDISITLSNGKSFNINTQSINLNNDKINLGSDGESAEQAVMGNSLNAQRKAILQSIAQIQVMTIAGPSTFPINILDFENQIITLDDCLSDKVKLD